jgi:hypothetical protein
MPSETSETQNGQIGNPVAANDPKRHDAIIYALGAQAMAAGEMYERTGQLEHLERAVALATIGYTQSLSFGANKYTPVVAYARALLARYDRTRANLDLDNALLALRSVVFDKAPIAARHDLHHAFADALHHDVSRTANYALLDDVMLHYQQASDLSFEERQKVYFQQKIADALFHKWRTIGNGKDAERALALFEDVWRRNRDPRFTSHFARVYGTALLKTVQNTRDAAGFAQAIKLLTVAYKKTSGKSGDYPIVAAALMDAHQRYFEQFDDPAALKKAIGVGENALSFLRGKPRQELRYRMGDQSVWYRVLEALVESYMSSASRKGDRSAALRRAFEVAESSKESLFLELFAKDDLSPATLDDVFGGSDASAAIAEIMRKALDSPSEPPQNQTKASSAEPPITWAEAAALAAPLGPRTAVVCCFCGQRKSWFFLVSSERTEPLVVEIAVGRTEWLSILQRLVKELMSPPAPSDPVETWFTALKGLSALQEPLRAFDRLVVSNHQLSSYVPWSVLCRHLKWRGLDGGFLPVTTVPSLRMLSRDMQRPAPTLSPLVIGDPLGDLGFAAAEAKAVAETFGVSPLIGAEATAQAVAAALREAQVIHFAGHGALSLGRDPVAFRLADGELSARDILQARPRARLVVLSACWSGVAVKATREEFFGLAEAFLLAGVDCVVAALWEINDEVSPLFFRKFYRRWLAGADPAEALRDAIDDVAAQSKWRHPHWWGAFTARGRALAKENHQGESHVD